MRTRRIYGNLNHLQIVEAIGEYLIRRKASDFTGKFEAVASFNFNPQNGELQSRAEVALERGEETAGV